MAGIDVLYKHFKPEEVAIMLARASAKAKEDPDLTFTDFQEELHVGYPIAMALVDWLADTHQIEVSISKHWIRRGRQYVRNNFFPSLEEMSQMLKIGARRSFLVMQALEKQKIIKIREDYTFERVGRAASFDDLVRQMKVVGKKYHGRCDPALLVRQLLVDPVTAFRLMQYGEEHLGLRWKRRPSHLL